MARLTFPLASLEGLAPRFNSTSPFSLPVGKCHGPHHHRHARNVNVVELQNQFFQITLRGNLDLTFRFTIVKSGVEGNLRRIATIETANQREASIPPKSKTGPGSGSREPSCSRRSKETPDKRHKSRLSKRT